MMFNNATVSSAISSKQQQGSAGSASTPMITPTKTTHNTNIKISISPTSIMQHPGTMESDNISNNINNVNLDSTAKKEKPQASLTTNKARDKIFHLVSAIGMLSTSIVNNAPPLDPILNPPYHQNNVLGHDPFWAQPSMEKEQIHDGIKHVFRNIIEFCQICDLDLIVAIPKKMELNRKKYPVDQCKVSNKIMSNYCNIFVLGF